MKLPECKDCYKTLEIDELTYREQIGQTLHLIAKCKYVPNTKPRGITFIPNLKIPTVKTKKRKIEERVEDIKKRQISLF